MFVVIFVSLKSLKFKLHFLFEYTIPALFILRLKAHESWRSNCFLSKYDENTEEGDVIASAYVAVYGDYLCRNSEQQKIQFYFRLRLDIYDLREILQLMSLLKRNFITALIWQHFWLVFRYYSSGFNG